MPSTIQTSVFVGLLAAAAKVSAHGFVQNVVVDGTSYTGYLVTQYPYETDPPASIGWTEDATDLGYVAPDAYATGDIVCHRDATNAQLSATVAAGGTVLLEWNTWPDSHHGPVIDYLANCNGDCSTIDKTTLEFFKIDEAGLISDATSPGTWATDELIAANNSWTVTIPSTIAAGSYVLRHEIIALHSANNADGAQNYPQCINLEVTGGGSDVPVGTLGESLYTASDAGILVNIYTTGLDYVIPGPTLYSGGSSGTVASVETVSVASSTSVSSAAPTTFATSVVASTPSATATSQVIAASPSSEAASDDDHDACGP